MSRTFTRLVIHVVFSTKDRRDLIVLEIEPDLHAYLGGICRNESSPALAIGGTANHVHLLISLGKSVAVSDLMLAVKKNSSKWIKTKGPSFSDFRWQDGYGAFTVGESQREAVIGYIQRQKERHKTMSFEDELVVLLNRYGVQHDPKYLWA